MLATLTFTSGSLSATPLHCTLIAGDGWDGTSHSVPSVTGVGGHVGTRVVWDPSIRQGTQCRAGSCGGWGLVLDIDNIVSTHWRWDISSVYRHSSHSSVLHQDWSVWDHDAEQRQSVQEHYWWTVRSQLHSCRKLQALQHH